MQGKSRWWALVAVQLVAVGGLVGCSSAAGGSATTARSTGASASSGVPGCTTWTAGKDGVIQTYCDGPATAKITLDGKKTTLTGGTCDISGSMFAVNLGVVTGSDFSSKKTKPDYVGLVLDTTLKQPGSLTITLRGKAEIFPSAEVKLGKDKKTAKVSGTSMDKKKATVEITCG